MISESPSSAQAIYSAYFSVWILDEAFHLFSSARLEPASSVQLCTKSKATIRSGKREKGFSRNRRLSRGSEFVGLCFESLSSFPFSRDENGRKLRGTKRKGNGITRREHPNRKKSALEIRAASFHRKMSSYDMFARTFSNTNFLV